MLKKFRPEFSQRLVGFCGKISVWIPSNIFIYQIPLQWRVVVASLTDVVWQSILSSSISSSSEDDRVSSHEEEIVSSSQMVELPLPLLGASPDNLILPVTRVMDLVE